ncbi:MAG: aldo/keto reductase [Gammaproteobacteria bacterium]|nr:MAG: aldo/keto reductase [Gammaproteobacteria bacterium]
MKRDLDIHDIKPGFDDLVTSRIGLGMAALGRPAYINLYHSDDLDSKTSYHAMFEHAREMLDTAYASGIRYFDTAASYGAGEKFLGKWLFDREFHIEGITVASKWGYRYTADWKLDAKVHEVKEHTLENLAASYVWSCLRLGRALRIYQIHSATFESGVLENTQVLNRLANIREDGRLVGLTVSGPRQSELIDVAIDIEIDGIRLFDVVQATWNPLETSASEALQRASDAGMAVVIKESLANGRLTTRNDEEDFKLKIDLLMKQAERLECTLDALVIASAVNQPWVNITLSGATTIDQLQSNLRALDVSWDDEAAHEVSLLAEKPEIYWQRRAGLKWS